MISRLIILVFFSITIQAIVAQDLEPVIIPAKVETKEVNTTLESTKQDVSDQVELGEEKPDQTENIEAPTINESNLKKAVRNPKTYRKEEYLNKLLRQTYYQRLTTSQWSKYLNPKGWNKSVQKWRYWSQLKSYVTGNDNDILVIRTPSDKTDNPATIKSEPLAIVDSSQVEIKEVSTAEIELVQDNSDSINDATVITALTSDQNDSFEIARITKEIYTDTDTLKETTPDVELTAVSIAPWLKEQIDDTSIDTLQSDLDIAEQSIEKGEEYNIEARDIVAKVEISITSNTNDNLQSSNENTVETISPEKANEVVAETTTYSKEEKGSNEVVPTFIEEPTISYSTNISAKDFHLLQGKVPWPVNGRITDRFGIRKNAEARGLKRENYGIDMICPTGTIVKAVHNGTVIMSRRQSPYDYIVTIKHGDYSSAYYYLITPYVKQGDIVQSGQAIGQLRTSVEEADFHFEIWNNTDRVNPEAWLNPK